MCEEVRVEDSRTKKRRRRHFALQRVSYSMQMLFDFIPSDSKISRGFQYRPHVPALFHSSYRFPPFQPYPDWIDSSCIAADAAGIQIVTSGICKSAKSAAILTSVAVVSFSKASLGPREGQSAAAPCLLDFYLLSNYNPAAFPL